MESIVDVCASENILLLADEVYQANVFRPDSKPFHSFKKVLSNSPHAKTVPLVSFHSISKGYSGECGRRGGFFELVNIDEGVLAEIYKMSSVNLCPPVSGQIGVDCLVRPPKEGGESYELWKEETEGIKDALKDRSLFMRERFNKLEGMTCQEAEVGGWRLRRDLSICVLWLTARSFLSSPAGRHVPLPETPAPRKGHRGRQGRQRDSRPVLLPRSPRCVVLPSPFSLSCFFTDTHPSLSLSQTRRVSASSPATASAKSRARSISGRRLSARASRNTSWTLRGSTRHSWPSTLEVRDEMVGV